MIRLRPLLLLFAAALVAPATLPAQQASARQAITIRSEKPPRGWIGVSWRLDPNYILRAGEARTRAAGFPTVSRVEEGSPAATAGLRVGDAIVSLNGRDSRDGPLFTRIDPGTRYVIRIRRGDEEREVTLTVARPEDMPAAQRAQPSESGTRATAAVGVRPRPSGH